MKRSISSIDGADPRPLDIIRWPGLTRYAEGLARQEARHQDCVAGRVDDALFLLEHSPVFTLGRRAPRHNILAAPEVLAERGIEVVETGRGGDVTYHGPGQVVGYPVIDLRPERKDVRRYVHDLEQVLIDTVAAFGVKAERVDGLVGVWVERQRKIGAIGVRISKWVTMHGFALNVTEEVQSAFRLIVPCGISDRAVTSLAQEVGSAPSFDEVVDVVDQCFRAHFGRRPSRGTLFEE
ncbi:MAG: lipoyl(octanoyl) transferase LipB [Myxococcota bacterium]